MPAPTGLRHGKATIEDRIITNIKSEYIPYIFGYRKLSKKYGIPVSTIRDWCTYATRRSASD